MANESKTITLRATPRWWQLIRRYRMWRSDRALDGATIIYNGQARVVRRYTPSNGVDLPKQ